MNGKLKKGDVKFQTSDNFRWYDKRDVSTLSVSHTAEFVNNRGEFSNLRNNTQSSMRSRLELFDGSG